MAGWTTQRKNTLVDIFVQGGLSPAGASGLVARWSVIENPGGNPGVLGGYKGRAYGHGQWLGDRQTKLFNFADANDLNPASDRTQALFALEEMNPQSPFRDNITTIQAGEVLRSASGPGEGARGASMFERAEGFNAQTGYDNFTGRTAEHAYGVQNDYDNSSALATLQQEGMFGDVYDPNAPSGGFGSDYNEPIPERFGRDPEVATTDPTKVAEKVEEGDIGEAGEEVKKAGDKEADETADAPPGGDLVEAINEQSEQLKKNTDALVTTSTQNTGSAVEAASGLGTMFSTLLSNLFVRGALVGLGAVLILAGVFGLAFGSKPVQQAVQTARAGVAKRVLM